MPGLGRNQEMNINRTAIQIQKIADDFNKRLITPVSSHNRNRNNISGGFGSYTMVSRCLSFWKQSGSSNTVSRSLPTSPKKK